MEDDDDTCLSALPAELLQDVAAALSADLHALGCLARTCHSISEALNADGAYAFALQELLGSRQDTRNARATVKSLSTLRGAWWAPHCVRPDGTCHHATFVHDDMLILFGGTQRYQMRGRFNTSTTWALDVRTAVWHEAATESAARPGARSFPADIGGCGGVLHDAAGKAWLLIFGGSRPGVRDNETWILGPLGPAASARSWRWFEVQGDGSAQSRSRPCPRFHHTMTAITEAGRDAILLFGGHNYRIDPIEEAYTLSLHDVDLQCEAHADGSGVELAGLERVRWRPWEPVDDGDGPGARARHTAVWWPHRGLVIIGGYHGDNEDAQLGFGPSGAAEPDCEVWWSQGPFIDGHAQWQQLPSMPEAAMPVKDEHGRLVDVGTLDVAAAVLRDNQRMLVLAGDQSGSPKLWLLEMAPWRWSRCELTGHIPRGPRAAWRAIRLCADVVLFWGGHDGSGTSSFGDPQTGHYAPHEAALARVITGPAEQPPVLRFGGCTGGKPPAAGFAGWHEHVGLRGRHRALLLHGLENQTELNGRRATLGTQRPNSRGRWKVECDPASASEGAVRTDATSRANVLVRERNMNMGTWMVAPTLTWCESLQLVVETHMELRDDDCVMVADVMRLWGATASQE